MDYKGENSARIALTLELLNVVKKHAGSERQCNGFWIMKRFLIADKAFWIQELGEEEYNRQLEHYSITNIEQNKRKELDEEARRIREEAKLKIDQLKAEAYAKQSDVAKEKLESEKPEEPMLPEPEDSKLKEFFESWKDRLEITETESEYQLRFKENYGSAVFTEILPIVKGFNGLFVSQGKHSFFRIPKVTAKMEMSSLATTRNGTQPVSPSPNSQ
jgi:NADH dehydrogenase/NADH:ubiquinone oxidoreductase subunit G